jgi:AcrR family transcriptional regulator
MLSLRERKKAKTKSAIQHHALRLFREQGYAETTVEQIAAAAEVSPSTFFRYFATKDDVVLTDLIDATTFRFMVDAPATLGPIEALSYALSRTISELSAEELELEITRNELIGSVPELRRGQLAEMTRPMGLLAEAVALRLGRPADDPDVVLYAGAILGALMSVMAGPAADDPRSAISGLHDVIARLDRVIHLPPA